MLRGSFTPFRMTNNYIDLAKKYLESTGISSFEIFYQEKERLVSEAKNSKIDSLTEAKTAGIAIRVIDSARLGFSYTTMLSPEKIEECVHAAVAGARETDPDEARAFVKPKKIEKFKWDSYDDDLKNVPVTERVDKALELEAEAKKIDTRIKKVRRSSYEELIEKTIITNSEGLLVEDRSTLFDCQIVAVAEDKGDSQWAWVIGFSHKFGGLDIRAIAADVAVEATALLGARNISTQRLPICIHPYAASQIMNILSKGFYGDNVFKKKSILAKRMGEKIFSNVLNIVDNGTLEGGYGSQPFDSEGSPRKKTYLVKNGSIQNWITDSYWAKKLGIESTSSSLRSSVTELPSIGPSNLYIEPGKSTQEQLYKKMGRGLYVMDLVGLHTANPITGEFSLGAAGLMIEDGEPSYPVKGVIVAGNLYDLFKNVVEIGSDLKFMGEIGSPTIMISEVQVSG